MLDQMNRFIVGGALVLLSTTAAFAQVPAFPGALGFGANATGGRNGTVYHVTTLANSGTGSFRDAVSSANRIVVFDVSGYISLSSAVSVNKNITIAGQTAPGGGIGFRGGEISFASRSNIICRYIRIRPGSETASHTDDCLSLYRAQNVICDHVSLEFGPWNNIGAVSDDWQNYPVTSVTFQNCLNADPSKYVSADSEPGQQFGAHTESVSSTMSWFYTIFANSHNRNPMSKINDVFVNNVLYNCSAGYTTHTGTEFSHDIVNNYFIAGPASSSENFPWYQVDNNQSIYYSGNLYDSDSDGTLGGSITTPSWYQGGGTVLTSPWSSLTTNIPIYSAATACRIAISQAGTLPRDQIDELVISQVKTLGSGTTGTGVGTTGPDGGLYNSQLNTGLGNNGYGFISGGLPAPDSDLDGMPDYWESAVGLNPASNDAMAIAADDYANIEHYLNWLADPHALTVTNTAVDVDLWQYTGGFTDASPVYSVNNASNGVVTLTNSHIAHFTPDTNFFGLGSFQFGVVASDGTGYTNTVTVAVAPLSWAQIQPYLIWRGDGVTNLWAVGSDTNWFDGSGLVAFDAGNTVVFDDTGSNTPAVNLSGALSAGTVYVLAGRNYTFGGGGALAGSTRLIKNGSGQLSLNTTNTCTGGTFIGGGAVQVGDGANCSGDITGNITNNGTLIFNTPGVVSNTANITGSGGLYKRGGGTLTLAGVLSCTNFTTIVMGTLEFLSTPSSARITNNSVLTFKPAGALNYGGTITGSGRVNIACPDITVTLTGANSYANDTVVDGGTLMVNNPGGSGTGTGAVTVNSGATLAGTGTIGGAVTVNSGGAVAPGASGIGTLTVSNSVTFNGGSTNFIEIDKNSLTRDVLKVSGTLAAGGTLVVTNLSGTLTAGDSFKIFEAAAYAGSFTNIVLPAISSDVMWYTNALMSAGTLSVVSTNFTGSQSLTWTGDSISNLWDTGSSLNWLTTNGIERVFYNGDVVTFDDTGSSSPAINLTVVIAPAAVAVNSSQDYALTGTGSLGGTMALMKSGTGAFTLANSGSNSYTGGTTIQGGTLQIGDGTSVNGSITGNITNNGTLRFANATAFTNASTITGSGQLRKTGAGALVLTGPQNYTGPITVSAGLLQINGAIPACNVTNNGILLWNPAGSQLYTNSISGSGSMTVYTPGVLTLAGPNSYSGNITNLSGFLVLSNNQAAGSGIVNYNNGYVVVAAGIVITNDFLILGSAAVDCCMMATNSGTATWAGNVSVNGSGQWRPGSDGGTLVFTGNADLDTHILVVPRGSVQFASNAVANSTVSGFLGRDNSGNKRSLNCTIRDNASVTMAGCSMGGGKTGASITVTLQDNAVLSFGANTVDVHNVNNANAISTLRLNGGALTVSGFTKTKTAYTNQINFNGGVLKAGAANTAFLPAFTVATNVVLAGGAIIDDGGFAIAIAAPLIHDPSLGATLDGGLTKLGAGTLTLSGANTFRGATLVNAGTLALASSGSIAISTNIGVAAGAVFDVSSVSGFSLGSGRTLWGNGVVIGDSSLGSGAILAPGSNAIGTLTFNNALTLAGGSTNIFEISHSPLTNDAAVVAGALTCGGTLIVTHSGTTVLTAGDSFKLFNAGSYNSGFAKVILPSLNTGLAWNTNALTTSGVIAVVPAPPTFGTITVTDSTLTLNGSGGMPTSNFYVLSSTNLTLPASNWTRLLTNQFDNNGNFILTNDLDPNAAQNFYRLQLP
jgi:autotransporter-associated beta strand protein